MAKWLRTLLLLVAGGVIVLVVERAFFGKPDSTPEVKIVFWNRFFDFLEHSSTGLGFLMFLLFVLLLYGVIAYFATKGK